MRRLARRGFELGGTVSGLSSFARRIHRDTVAVLAYHNVVLPEDAGRGDASLHMPLPQFLKQIDRLARTHQIVDLEGALARPQKGRPRAVVTFDDAYRGAVTLALPELAKRNLPAVVFVSPGLLGAKSTWWDELAEAGLLSAQMRRSALVALAGRADAIRTRVLEGRAAPRLPDSYGISTTEDLRNHGGVGISFGSHAWAHEHLPSLSLADVEANLRKTMEWLADFNARSSSWFALPYGAGSPGVNRLACDLGHSGVLRISGGLWEPALGRALLPRINVPAEISLRGLELRTSGLRR